MKTRYLQNGTKTIKKTNYEKRKQNWIVCVYTH